MTVTLKTKIVRKRSIRLKFQRNFPAALFADIGIAINKSGGTYTIVPDYSSRDELTQFDPSQEEVLIYNKATQLWHVVSLANLVNNATLTTVIITSGATYAVGVNDKIIAVNKSPGSATTITLPLSSLKVGPVRIIDFKGDAGTNNITVNVTGSDKLNGNLTSWIIANDGGSILLTPLSGIGYAVS